jgi:hypothetical protein
MRQGPDIARNHRRRADQVRPEVHAGSKLNVRNREGPHGRGSSGFGRTETASRSRAAGRAVSIRHREWRRSAAGSPFTWCRGSRGRCDAFPRDFRHARRPTEGNRGVNWCPIGGTANLGNVPNHAWANAGERNRWSAGILRESVVLGSAPS